MPHRYPSTTSPFDPAEPLWKRVPTRDHDGRPFSDFMMLIPRLRSRPQHILQATIGEIQGVLEHYRKVVVFADLNLKLNVLWVSVRPVPGICLELPAAIKTRVPDVDVVLAHSHEIAAKTHRLYRCWRPMGENS